jgi:hypothetical protein
MISSVCIFLDNGRLAGNPEMAGGVLLLHAGENVKDFSPAAGSTGELRHTLFSSKATNFPQRPVALSKQGIPLSTTWILRISSAAMIPVVLIPNCRACRRARRESI